MSEAAIGHNNPVDATHEEWRVSSIAPTYAVSDFGRIKRIANGRTRLAGTLLHPTPRRKNGYLCVSLVINERPTTVFVHRLVCTEFHGPQPTPAHQVAHYDGVITNNHKSNLRWATPQENADDKRRHGTILKGANHPANTGKMIYCRGQDHWSAKTPQKIVRGSKIGTSKLSERQILEIRAEPQYHGVTVALAKRFGVSDALIGRIRRGLQWRHV